MAKKEQKEKDPFEDICDHQRAGIVTNQPGKYDHDRAHASVAVCGDPSCRALAFAWVKKMTGEEGVYLSDSDRKIRHG